MKTGTDHPFDQWLKEFRPLKNEVAPDAPFGGAMFETFGTEAEKVNLAFQANPKTIWTLTQEDGVTTIQPGVHFANRLGYFVTEMPWVAGQKAVTIFDEEKEKNGIKNMKTLSEIIKKAQEESYFLLLNSQQAFAHNGKLFFGETAYSREDIEKARIVDIRDNEVTFELDTAWSIEGEEHTLEVFYHLEQVMVEG